MKRFDPARRDFLKRGLAISAALSLPGCSLIKLMPSDIPKIEEVPDFSQANVLKHAVGIRPYRKKKVRLERIEVGEKIIVHNYGYGGAGFTMAWGAAELAAEMAHSNARPREPVAVLGGGVVGLSTARVLLEQGHPVTIYAEAFSPRTTSDLAGAQWSPTAVARGENCYEQGIFDDILKRSYRRYTRLDERRYGIARRHSYVSEEGFGGPLEKLPQGLIPPSNYLRRLPFPGKPHRGKLFRTLLIEPPIYLPALTSDIKAGGAKCVEHKFSSLNEVTRLVERVIVNCLGLGAGAVFNDSLIYPIRGQLVYLKPKALSYLLVHSGYFFPRSDSIVVGGTFEKGVSDTTPNLETAQKILDVNHAFFWNTRRPTA